MDPSSPSSCLLERSRAGPLLFLLLSLLVGLGAGAGAVFFRGLIAIFHNGLLLGRFSWAYDASVHTPPSPWGPGIILVPIIASFGVNFLITHFAPEARGHGVPEVMEAIYYHKGVIRPVVALLKALASALSIGSGGSVGREGPIAQIGSALGSGLGQFLSLSVEQRVTLIAAGAGAGIAATFNTPVGGVLFAVELMLSEVSANTLVPVALAAAIGAFVGRLAFGSSPAFTLPIVSALPSQNGTILLPFYGALGVVLAAASALYIKALYFAEDCFGRIRSTYWRHAAGMAVVGALMYALLRLLGHYYTEGVGYAAIQDIFGGGLRSVWILLLLCALKLISTCATLGSGASGGVFSPGLFMGATLGAAFACAVHAALPAIPIDVNAFAIAGMAGVIGGSTGAAMTAIVMTLEMTLDYQVVLPMTITVALSYGLRTMALRDSIYTLKLARRGRAVPMALRAELGSTIAPVLEPARGGKEKSTSRL